MSSRRRGYLSTLAAVLVASAPGEGRADDGALFREQVWPLLQRACVGCHGEDDPENGLRVDGREALLLGGKAGPAVKPGSPAQSLLIQAVRGKQKGLMMPPKRPLSEREIAVLETWIERGAPWPAPPTVAAAPAPVESGPRWRPAWWREPPRLAPPPALVRERHRRRATGDIDRFVLAELESLGIDPVGLADRATWLRRATYVMTGTLPTAAEIDAFTADRLDDQPARERAVDRLLRSPRYGERWARVWMREVLPEVDELRAGSTPAARATGTYEAWVAAAWNRDLPLDAFVHAHLPAADRRSSSRGGDPGALELLTLAAAIPDVDQSPADAQVAVVGRAFLALDVDCARCHDHPTDPLRVADHRALAALLAVYEEQARAAPAAPQGASGATSHLEISRNPLVARVVVNRIWRQYFGRGLVATVDDFGARGEPPTHRDLLDHLAAKLIASGGSLKSLHREIALSATFALAATRGDGQEARDPDNAFLWRANPRPIDEETVAEAVAALAGGRQGRRDRRTPAARIWARVCATDGKAAARTGKPDLPAQIGELYRLLLARRPGGVELELALRFLSAGPDRGPALTSLLLDSDELRWLP